MTSGRRAPSTSILKRFDSLIRPMFERMALHDFLIINSSQENVVCSPGAL
jgi:hypothetical protein